ncbi:AQG_2a_G0013170.mRNA.1.CDS.1 [Saccharomyces cerevisiae]|uniref:Endopolyphosphatase n=3 Tax=Saccharomyces cerevisiae TaxID=4932 RepID=PPN1_YEAST|nr:endopolyphosphatase [Saccharomyces cerevisiae S288C]Q04119.1 RecName: Full=Endopolyphosphatase; AltName: Full=Deoxyadenosine triphosphate phosphohydrolase; Short=dATP phosphohydrolase; AltName: Full=Exopolyphosphatase; AltName: Full=Phosphate metabolism protein 5; Flags: Precursor [Saccharomyces cerevisiae S288C]AAB64872.1 Ydr452wp [Saccharomyces cerevisiae]AJU58249.1 Ppn1p [Saccharomyces cerevisiae YJM189]AJU63826.1 Ppn1p [Saccharomyces cerevisiae YJM326]AJU66625.1 Ppn1p [Saccharomyces cer|eukprot:NP_010740.3 endopolyphosphatase [Saccharomyces cerevisiae S288C]
MVVVGKSEVRNVSMSRPKKKSLIAILSTCVLFFLVFIIGAKFQYVSVFSKFLDDRGDNESLQLLNDIEFTRLGLTPREPVIIKDVKTGKERKLHGRFLHITDIHPDPYYVEGSSIDAVCHTGKPSKKKDVAPKFGKAMSGCDSPVILMEETLRWIKENLRDKIDFVIWTGDNIRHDNDRKHPRTEAQIFDMNNIVADKMTELFSAGNEEDPRDFDVSVIPSLGNNDVFPHNMFALGPTLQTREYYRIWKNFVPQQQQRTFDRSASFLTEVIPGKLAVLSINTLYLFKANPLVDNCNSKKEPGYQLLLWFGYVLEELRSRGMKVWLSGHVPPIAKNFDQSCYDKFTLWTHEYRDIIIGGLYGHMNIDHFIPTDGKKARKSLLKAMEQSTRVQQGEDSNEEDEETELNRILDHAMAAKEVFLMGAKPSNKEAYMNTVRDTYYRKVWNKLERVDEKNVENEKKKKEKKDKKKKKPITRKELIERYSIVNIGGSVIPTFNPSFRIWEYNITDIVNDSNFAVSEYKPWDEFFESLNKIMEDSLLEDEMDSSNIEVGINREKMGEKKNKKKKKNDKTMPIEMPDKYELGPAYVPQLFTPTRFVQFYADLEKINQELHNSFVESKDIFRYEIEYTSDEKPYSMDSLTVGSYLDLAGRLYENKPAWEKYVEWSFASSGYKDD